MNKYKKLGKNIAFITIGNFASKILSFLLVPFYTAVLTTAEYGTADLMTTTIHLLSPFFSLLISEAVMRYALMQNIDKKQVLTIGLTITMSGFLVMLLFSPLTFFFDTLKQYYMLFIFYYLGSTLQMLLSQFVKGIEKVAVYSMSGVFHTLTYILLNLLFLLVFDFGVTGYLLSLIISNFLTVVFLCIGAKLHKYVTSIKKIDATVMFSMLKYSVPLIPNSISWWISNSSDKYILTLFSGVALTGVYSVSQKIPSLFAVVSTIFMGAWQISAVEDFGSKESQKFYTDVYRKYSSLNIILVSVLIFFTKIMAKILFSNEFYAAWLYIPVLLLSFLFNAMAGFLGSIYTSAQKTKMVFISTIIAAALNIVANMLLIPVWGAMGAGIATLLSYFVIWIIRLVDTAKIVKIHVDYKRDITSYILLIAQALILCLELKYEYLLMGIILISILFINKEFFKTIFTMMKKMLR